MSDNKTMLTVKATVNVPVSKVWEYWTKPEHITGWAFASPEWHTPSATNDLTVGGKFSSRMEAKDGSMGFDFWGIYDVIEENKYIEYTMGDGRKVQIHFSEEGENTTITEDFEPESQNPLEMQQMGWQAIMDNFKKYAEQTF